MANYIPQAALSFRETHNRVPYKRMPIVKQLKSLSSFIVLSIVLLSAIVVDNYAQIFM